MTTTMMKYLGVGKENATNREALSMYLGITDRQVRRLIQIARDDGALILNAQDGKGYYLADASDLDDIERQYRQDTARAMSILKRRKAMRRLLKEAGRKV